MRDKIIFRADGNSEIGLGHVVRSLALADMLNKDFNCVFAIQQPSEALCKQIKDICPEIIVLPCTTVNGFDPSRELEPFITGKEIVVLDGYKFDTPYQKHLKDKGCLVVCIDDIHAYHFVADVVINHGLLTSTPYSSEGYTKFLLGPNYSLLRKPFLSRRNNRNLDNGILLCFGGADPNNLTKVYLERLITYGNTKEVHIIIGSAYKHRASLLEVLKQTPGIKMSLNENVSAHELVKIMQKCDVAIVPSSTILLECASVGIGIITGHYVNNQIDINSMASETGIAISIGDLNDNYKNTFYKALENLCSLDFITHMIEVQNKYFDGNSSKRLLGEFLFLKNKVS